MEGLREERYAGETDVEAESGETEMREGDVGSEGVVEEDGGCGGEGEVCGDCGRGGRERGDEGPAAVHGWLTGFVGGGVGLVGGYVAEVAEGGG